MRELCRCGRWLFTPHGWRGRIEIKCPRCRRYNHYDYGSDQAAVKEIRCSGTYSYGSGWCGQLIMRISTDAAGSVFWKCPRCRHERTLKIDAPQFAFST